MKMLVLFFLLTCLTNGMSQEPTTCVKVECGDSVESEFTQPVEAHEYIVSMNAGDKLKVAVAPIGDYLSTAIFIFEPAGNFILGDFERKQTPVIETGALSARGDYKFYVLNYEAYGERSSNNDPFKVSGSGDGRAGTYTVLIGCTLRDGTVIEAGSSQ
jgi:hypothetical protein